MHPRPLRHPPRKLPTPFARFDLYPVSLGQSVMHLHLHVIPRYQGDMEEPKGGVRGVIPGKRGY
nr:HIT domain-containing protein [Methanocalculus chunghsingensis]